MRNVQQVLREKENDMRRVAREVEILRQAIPLLTYQTNGSGAREIMLREVSAEGRRSDMLPGEGNPGDVLPDDVWPGEFRRPEDARPGEGPPADVRPDIFPVDDPLREKPQLTDIFPNGTMKNEEALNDQFANSEFANGGFADNEITSNDFEYRGFPVLSKGAPKLARPSVLGLDSDEPGTNGGVEADEVGSNKVSSRLKRFTRPLVSFMAG